MPLKPQDLLMEEWALAPDKTSIRVTEGERTLAYIRQALQPTTKPGEVDRCFLRARLVLSAQNGARLAVMVAGLAKQREERGDSGAGGIALTEVEWHLLRDVARRILDVSGGL